jgi:hypothetical protein
LAAKKQTEQDKLLVRTFKDGSQNWWLNLKHFTIIDSKLICAAGGVPTEEERVHMEKYLKTKN